jgi:hypothetical protein
VLKKKKVLEIHSQYCNESRSTLIHFVGVNYDQINIQHIEKRANEFYIYRTIYINIVNELILSGVKCKIF